MKIKDQAFGRWLKKLDKTVAEFHIRDCMASGGPENMAWKLWEEAGSPDLNNPLAFSKILDYLEEDNAN